MKKRSILILFLSVIGLTSFAYPSMIVEHYTAERGLPNNIVNCTLKGSEGFVWFGTWYGLCSFDGTKFRSYDNRDGFYSADIPPRKIQRIVEDKNGFLSLTDAGKKVAEKIYERHLFFTEKLLAIGVSRKTAEQDACRIEHVISEESFTKLKIACIKLK